MGFRVADVFNQSTSVRSLIAFLWRSQRQVKLSKLQINEEAPHTDAEMILSHQAVQQCVCRMWSMVQFNVGVSLKTKTTEDDLKGKQRRTKTAAQSWADLIKTVTYCVTTAHLTEACTCFHNVCLNVHVNDALASAEVTAETETQISDSVYWKHEPQRTLTDWKI